MLGDLTLHHLISHRLQVESFSSPDDFLYRKALKKLRYSASLEDFFVHLPKAFHVLTTPLSSDLSKEWKDISAGGIPSAEDTLYKAIERTFAGQLKISFFISVAYHTLAWQCHHLFFTVGAQKDKDIKRYLLMSRLLYDEELLTKNHSLNGAQDCPIRTCYSLLIAYQWSVIQCYYGDLVISTSLNYDSSEIHHLLEMGSPTPEITRLAQLLKEDLASLEKNIALDLHQKKLEDLMAADIKPPMDDKRYITTQQAAHLLEKSATSTRRYHNEGRLPTIKKEGKKNYFLRKEVEVLREQLAKEKSGEMS